MEKKRYIHPSIKIHVPTLLRGDNEIYNGSEQTANPSNFGAKGAFNDEPEDIEPNVWDTTW